MNNFSISGNTMVGRCDDGGYVEHNPRICTTCGEDVDPVEGCRCDQERREAKALEEALKDDWTTCDFCGEPVRPGHYCPECSELDGGAA